MIMIKCSNVSKIYGEQLVIDSFSYTFADRGFYLLLGESGSGKTTLLNLISGMIPFDDGVIGVDDQAFRGRVGSDCFQRGMDYITQDPFFIDYLSVRENLKVAKDDDASIDAALERFGLLDQAELLPGKLSGGEQQRLALARALLTEKKVLLLDEPTASLDMKNKTDIFALIKQLSEECLVICASHDRIAREYADQIIWFTKRKRSVRRDYSEGKRDTKVSRTSYSLRARTRKKGLVRYLAKWFSSERRGKKADVFLLIFFALAFLLCLMADTPEGKKRANEEYVYRLNSLTLRTTSKDVEYFTSLEGQYGITDVVLSYRVSSDEQVGTDIADVLPFEEDSFRLADRIAAGTWFQEKYDVILSAEMADRLASGDWESLIGTTLRRSVYGEKIKFRIVGVLGYLNDFERQYLSSTGVKTPNIGDYNPEHYDFVFYANGLVTEDLLEDETFYADGQRTYQLYFDSYKSMTEFLESYDGLHGELSENSLSGGLEASFTATSAILIPLALLMILLSVLFYANILGTELAYNGRFISAFHYLGYDLGRIIRSFAALNMLRVLGMCAVSMAGTVLVTLVLNGINERLAMIGFRIFTYNPLVILGFAGTITLSSAVAVYFFLHRVRAKSWYENITETRDLL